MAKDSLSASTQRLRDAHRIGLELYQMLELGPSGKQAKDGEVEKAAKMVGERFDREISYELARKMILFSERYTKKQLESLVQQCRTHGFAIEFGALIRLLPVKDLRVRNRVQLMAIKNEWSKRQLEQELQRQRPGKQLLDTRRRGRKPRALSSRDALLGEVHADAVKWTRILEHLKEADNEVWAILTRKQKNGIEELAKLLQRLSRRS